MGVGGLALKGPGAAGSRVGCSGGQPVPSSRGPSLEEPRAWFVLWNLLQLHSSPGSALGPCREARPAHLWEKGPGGPGSASRRGRWVPREEMGSIDRD